jgi:PAS domain S-box-containing protein
MHGVVYRSFADLEEGDALKDHSRVLAGIAREQRHLQQTCSDWSNWDDTYAFAMDRNAEYITANLQPQTFVTNELCMMYIYDAGGDLVWGQARNPFDDDTSLLDVPEMPRHLPEGHFLWAGMAGELAEGGLIETDAGLMIIATQPILTTKGEGPTRGLFVMARLLGDEMRGNLSEQSKAPVDIRRIASSSGTPEQTPVVVPVNAERVDVVGTLSDVTGRPIAMLTTSTPRDVTRKGMATIKYVSGIVVVLMLLAYGLMVAALNVFVIRPIRQLKSYMRKVVEHDAAAARIELRCSDELGDLSHEFNSLISELEHRNEEKQAILRRHEEMVSNLPVGLYRAEIGPEGEILMVNPALCKLFGYDTPEEICRAPKAALYADIDAMRGLAEQLEVGDSLLDRQVEFQRRDGSRFWGSLTARLIREDDGVQFVDVAILDVTTRIEAEAQLERSLDELKQFNELAVGRELRMVELKREVNQLARELGRDEPYRIRLNITEHVARA